MDFVTQCEKIAKQNFSIPQLRPAQKEVFLLMQEKKYVLATLPTGSGKTLLYAVPSLIFQNGIVLVISPLISLMRDQARRMNEAKIPCVILTSEQSDQERTLARMNIKNKVAKIIFVSPERFVLPSFLNLISNLNIAMAVVDEAHCVVSWGHQFRPEYSELSKSLTKLNPPRILAITATAGRNTRQHIIQKVFPQNVEVSEFTSKPLSSHIHVESIRLFSHENQWLKLVDILTQTKSQKTIVYFPTRKLCDEFAIKMRKLKIHGVVYHAGLNKQDRQTAEGYIHAATQKIVVCATTAFGMGVDISGIYLVLVYGFPANIEEFFQMLGRAGRAGEASRGILLWTGSDPIKRQFQFKSSFPLSSQLIEYAYKVFSFFPKLQEESSLVLKSDFISGMVNSSQKNSLKICDGILSGLRICGVLEEAVWNENYFQIQFSKSKSFQNMFENLPLAITKRKKGLEALKEFIHPNLINISNTKFAIPISILVELSELPEVTLEQVFTYYQDQQFLTYKKIMPSREECYIILKHNFIFLQKELSKYSSARQHFLSSLHELEKLSTATTCRLASSFDFFSARSLQGASKKSYFCMQCDLCTKREKGISIHGD